MLSVTGRLRAIPGCITDILSSKTRRLKRPHLGRGTPSARPTILTSIQGSFSGSPSRRLSTITSPGIDPPPVTPPPAFPSDYPTKFLLIFISYKGQTWPNGTSKELEGTTNDLELVLRAFNYRHSQHGHFKIVSDVNLVFRDCDGIERQVKGKYPTRANIKRAIMSVCSRLISKDNCLIWVGGHGIRSPLEGSPQDGAFLSVDGLSIYGRELRTWLTKGVDHWALITVVLDACHSDNLLGLPFSYDENNGNVELGRTLAGRMNNNLTLIAAAGADEAASSVPSIDPDNMSKLYGILTWVLLDILSDPSRGGTRDCIKQLYSKVAEYSQQQQNPHVTASQKPPRGELAIFNMPCPTDASDASVIGGRWPILRLALTRLRFGRVAWPFC